MKPNVAPLRERAAFRASAASAVLCAIKGAGFAATGSSALLASAVDSAGDALMSFVNGLTVRAAGAPPDAGHPFGHGKFEHLGALVQATLLFGGAAVVAYDTATAGIELRPLREPLVGAAVAAVSTIAAFLLSKGLESAAKRHHSPALEADAAHYASDWLAGAGVLVAIGLDRAFGWTAADQVVAALICAAVVRLAWKTAVTAVNGLLDVRLAADELRLIDGLVRKRAPVVRGYHDLMTRRSGPTRFVQMHLEIDANLSFREAHRLVEKVVADVRRALPNAVVTIHADPHPERPDDGESDPIMKGPLVDPPRGAD
jgi:ferrous-iron efflux pump FieF